MRKNLGMVLFVLTGVMTVVATKNSFFTAGKGINDPLAQSEPGYEVSYVIGSYLLPVIALAVGLWLFVDRKPKP